MYLKKTLKLILMDLIMTFFRRQLIMNLLLKKFYNKKNY